MQHPFLVHQAYRSVGEGQKTVIFLVQAVTVARKRTDEQFQLVVCTLTDMYAHAPKSVFQVIRAFLKVGVGRHAHHHVEVRVHEQFAFTGYYVLYLLDVLSAIWLLGLGMLACRFFFLSSNASSRF